MCLCTCFKNPGRNAKPSTSISVQDACFGEAVALLAGNPTPSIPIHQWYWFTGDGKTDSTENPYHYYPAGGEYTVGVYALNDAGCSSDTVNGTADYLPDKRKTGE